MCAAAADVDIELNAANMHGTNDISYKYEYHVQMEQDRCNAIPSFLYLGIRWSFQ